MRKALFKFFAVIFAVSFLLLSFVVIELNYVGVLIQYTLTPIVLISGVITFLLFKKEYFDDFGF